MKGREKEDGEFLGRMKCDLKVEKSQRSAQGVKE